MRKALPVILGNGGPEDISLDSGFLDRLAGSYEERVQLDERMDR